MNRKSWYLLLIPIILEFSALMGCFAAGNAQILAPLQFALGIAILILGYLWCSRDAEERGIVISHTLWMLLILLLVVGIPVYLIRSRGAKGILSIGLFVLYALGLFILVIVTVISFEKF